MTSANAYWLELTEYLEDVQPAQPVKLSRQTEIMKRIIEYIHENYEKDISIDILASYVGISRAECFRCFKKYIGMTPTEYINNFRLSQAAKLLTSTELSLVEISLRCGFESQSYFGKLFKKRYGVTPLNYRKNIW